MPLPATLNLSALTAETGQKIVGLNAVDQLGICVHLADLNGDGFIDLIVGARGASSYTGATYVILGDADGLPDSIDLAGLAGTNGYVFTGQAGAAMGGALSSGDLNDDGLIDLVVGGTRSSGHVSVVFGQSTAGPASIGVAGLNGANGANFTSGLAGYSVQAMGDINGDGIDDLAIGDTNATGGGAGSGAVYVVFGKTSGWTASTNLGTLNGTDGFRIDGLANGTIGHALTSIDLNQDGFDDLVIGGRRDDVGGLDSGSVRVVFGMAGGWSASQSVAGLDGVVMSVATPDLLIGSQVSNLGDLNGDGLDDLGITGSQSATAYVVYGKATPWTASLDLAALDGTDGFKLIAPSTPTSIASAGDVNNDGFQDLLVGSIGAGSNRGGAFVLYGRSGGWSATESLAGLDGVRGFTIEGQVSGDLTGRSVTGGADLNGDGIDDIVLGAAGQDAGGNASGAFYIVYGRQGAINRVGTAAAETLTGASEADTLSGLARQDILQGFGGDDNLDGGANADVLFGGDGADDLIGGTGGDVLWGGTGDDGLDGGADGDKLYGEDGADVLQGGDGNDMLFGGAGIDSLTGGAGNDTLDGGGQADTLAGGEGNDIYVITAAGATITEAADQGYDIVRSDITLTLAANLEALQLQGSADLDGTGNGLANNLQGNSGANVLSGGAGVDTLNGNDGDDAIVGGSGNDLLRGGTGADRFEVLAESIGNAVLETDQVYDFSTAEGDWIDLSAVDAKAGGVDDAFTLVGAFTKQAGEMTLTFAGGITTLRLDINGDGRVDYQMKINGDVTGDSAGWAL